MSRSSVERLAEGLTLRSGSPAAVSGSVRGQERFVQARRAAFVRMARPGAHTSAPWHLLTCL